uniref:PWWP domain-containing protein n=1 Tax=Mandrillus leucophaeus TaxID=9568 RepID=A0A2K5XHQ9_MANLE
MDFSFSFMQGITGNTVQRPPQLIDSTSIHQEDAFDNNSDIAENGGQTPYEATLQQSFQYLSTTHLPSLTNGYHQSACMKLKPNTSRIIDILMGQPMALVHHSPPSVPQTVIPKKTGSPEVKLKITRTIQNGRELFKSSLCGDLLNEVQASEHTRSQSMKAEKRKKTKKHDSSRSEECKSHKIPKLEPEEQNRPNERVDTISEKPREDPVLKEEAPVQPILSSVPTTEVSTGVKFQVGDLVWSKVRTYPCDPQLEVHFKINTRGAREYHVQCFSKQPERAWVHEKWVQEYKDHKQYEELLAEATKRREHAQWDFGFAHAEKHTFIYIDKQPEEGLSQAKKNVGTNAGEMASSLSSTDIRRHSQRQHTSVEEEEPPPVKIAWKTVAARKSYHLDLQKCNMSPAVKIEQVGWEINQLVYSTKGIGNKTEISVRGQDRLIISRPNQRNEKPVQNISSLEATSGSTGSAEKKQQRRSIRTRSESEKSTEVVSKKIRKEQVETVPRAAVKTRLQEGWADWGVQGSVRSSDSSVFTAVEETVD